MVQAGKEGIGIPVLHHHCTEIVAVTPQHAPGLCLGHPFALAQVKEFLDIDRSQFAGVRIDDLNVTKIQTEAANFSLDLFFVAEQNRDSNPFFDKDLGGAQYFLLFPFREDDPFRSSLGLIDELAHDLF